MPVANNSVTPRQIGLKDVHVALIESDGTAGTVYATPVKISRAITAKITPSVNNETLYSDDGVEDEGRDQDNASTNQETPKVAGKPLETKTNLEQSLPHTEPALWAP